MLFKSVVCPLFTSFQGETQPDAAMSRVVQEEDYEGGSSCFDLLTEHCGSPCYQAVGVLLPPSCSFSTPKLSSFSPFSPFLVFLLEVNKLMCMSSSHHLQRARP